MNNDTKTLWDDLEQYADETFTKKDLKAGMKMLGEIAGLLGLVGLGITIMTVWLPGVGVTVGASTVAGTLGRLVVAYAHMPLEERKKIRAAVVWLKGGVFLGNRFI